MTGSTMIRGGVTPQRAAAHGLALAVVTTVGVLAWWRATRVWPFDIDNLVSFTFTGGKPWFLYQESSGSGGYRPVGTLSIWLQELAVGVSPRSYFAVNLALWIATAGALYALTCVLTRSVWMAAAAALALVVDGRVHTALIQVVERQNTTAVLFGVAALLLVLWRGGEDVSRAQAFGVFGLLAGAALSKEPGLAFTAAVAAWAALHRPHAWHRLLAASAGAVALFLVLRTASVHGRTFCETMGLWDDVRAVCYGPARHGEVSLMGMARLEQQAYNAGAMLVGTFLPFVFDRIGSLQSEAPPAGTVVFFSTTTILAIVGWVVRPRVTLPLLVLVIANAVLGVLHYRTRNQLIGMVGVYATAAVGAQWLLTRISQPEARRLVAFGAGVMLCFWVNSEAHRRADDMREEVLGSMQRAHTDEPCEHVRLKRIRGRAYVSRDAVRRLRVHYRLPDPGCDRVLAALGSA